MLGTHAMIGIWRLEDGFAQWILSICDSNQVFKTAQQVDLPAQPVQKLFAVDF